MRPQKNSKEVSKFLGMSQWYAKFIKNYLDLCEPLYNLKKKFQKFLWSVETQKACDAIKQAITEASVLKLPDFKQPFQLFTDASSIGIEAVLTQEQRPIAYGSCTLSSAERNYTRAGGSSFATPGQRGEMPLPCITRIKRDNLNFSHA
ncbi:retrovirus-related Pol polyprotein from transposon 17.6 [Trichonephila clavipes]|nr:retrovirus-related Pol polyprotein from transposon 17.6 [Trichonephila clavipes]